MEWLEQQAKKDNSEVKSFLQNPKIKNSEKIEKVLNTENFYVELENFLNNANAIDKIKLTNQLNKCEDKEEIKSVLIENLYKETWYNINSKIIRNISEEASSIDNDKQANIENQQANIESQQADIESQQANIESQKANIESQKTTETVSWQKELNDAIEARLELVKGRPELHESTKKDSVLFNAKKAELEKNWVIQQLRDSNHDDDFIDNYILVHTTLKELKQNKQYNKVDFTLFEKFVKNLDNACNIPDTKFDNFSKDNIGKTRTELFDADIWNYSLREAKKLNEKSYTHQKKYNEIFSLNENVDMDAQLIKKYWRFVEDDELKDLVKRYKSNKLYEQERNTLREWLKNIKENIDNQTKDLIEEMCLIAPIQWIFACIGSDLGNKFELNKSREINNENWEFTITWHIDWIQFSLRHDTNDPEPRLQTSSILTKTNNKFEIWERFEDSPYKLPTNWDIFTIATSCITEWNVSLTQNASDYFKLLQKKIFKKIKNNLYKKAKDATPYIKNKIEWEKVSKKAIWLIQGIKKADIWWIVFDRDEKLFNYINSVDFNVQYSGFETRQTMFNCISKIQDIIKVHTESDMKHIDYPDIIKHFLANKTIITDTEHLLKWEIYDSTNVWTVFDLFKEYEVNSYLNDWQGKIIDRKSLWNDLNWTSSNCSLIAQKRSDKEKADTVDTDLENALNNID